jgi:hypothetical protein
MQNCGIAPTLFIVPILALRKDNVGATLREAESREWRRQAGEKVRREFEI